MNLLSFVQKQYPLIYDINVQEWYELPADRLFGEVALPCFQLAQHLNKSPGDIAKQIASELSPIEGIEKIEATGPYVNFSFSTVRLAQQILPVIGSHKEKYGKGSDKKEHIVIESPGPNTNKPLHLGHVRNMLLGNSLAEILAFAGYHVTKVDIINDRGVHICKSMLAYQLFGNNQQPTKKPDHFVGDRYVRYAQEAEKDPQLDERIQEMLQKREKGDPIMRELQKRMNTRTLEGMKQTYARYGTQIDKVYYESDHYLEGKAIVEMGLNKGIFEINTKGNTVFHDDELGEKVVLRSDGTSVYLTQDLALAQLRYDDRKMDRMIYIVGSEQEDHFKFLFRILQDQGLPFANKCYHLSYGMISLPDGKMKSRQGNTVDADNLATLMHDESQKLLQERYPDLSERERNQRAEAIAMAAIKFFVLKYDAAKDFVFDRTSSLSFEGETGPYIQYTLARATTLLKKSVLQPIYTFTHLTTIPEKNILVALADFPEIIQCAANQYQPALLARYLFELARLFNTYYHHEKILVKKSPIQQEHLALVTAVQSVLTQGLTLLGIEILEEM